MKTNNLNKLHKLLRGYKRVLIAYSGGVDSTFLTAAAVQVLGKTNVLAVTAVSETYPGQELVNARRFAAKIGVKHMVIRTLELSNKKFRSNPLNRCFHCKDELFRKLFALAKKNNMALCDATNYSDQSDFRPGRLAAKKWGVRSPVLEAMITKTELRKFSRAMKLPNWNEPAQACLASRIPYGTAISELLLARIEKAEAYLKRSGFSVFRVRHHGEIARIELGKNELEKFFKAPAAKLAGYFRKLGWRYVTVDIEGYRTGSLNPKLRQIPKYKQQITNKQQTAKKQIVN